MYFSVSEDWIQGLEKYPSLWVIKQPDLRSLQIKETVHSNILVMLYYDNLGLLYTDGQKRKGY